MTFQQQANELLLHAQAMIAEGKKMKEVGRLATLPVKDELEDHVEKFVAGFSPQEVLNLWCLRNPGVPVPTVTVAKAKVVSIATIRGLRVALVMDFMTAVFAADSTLEDDFASNSDDKADYFARLREKRLALAA